MEVLIAWAVGNLFLEVAMVSGNLIKCRLEFDFVARWDRRDGGTLVVSPRNGIIADHEKVAFTGRTDWLALVDFPPFLIRGVVMPMERKALLFLSLHVAKLVR